MPERLFRVECCLAIVQCTRQESARKQTSPEIGQVGEIRPRATGRVTEIGRPLAVPRNRREIQRPPKSGCQIEMIEEASALGAAF